MPTPKPVHLEPWKFTNINGLHKTKGSWEFELDILNTSGVIATQNIFKTYRFNKLLGMYLWCHQIKDNKNLSWVWGADRKIRPV